MRADMIIAGDQSGWKDLTYAAAPVACGHTMDVPESMLYATLLPDTGDSGDHAARMSIPGADRSGCSAMIIQMHEPQIWPSSTAINPFMYSAWLMI